jgi:hypothetical protein
MKQRPMVFAAIEAMTKSDPVWAPRRNNSNIAAKTTTRESIHTASPLESNSRDVRNEARWTCTMLYPQGHGGAV